MIGIHPYMYLVFYRKSIIQNTNTNDQSHLVTHGGVTNQFKKLFQRFLFLLYKWITIKNIPILDGDDEFQQWAFHQHCNTLNDQIKLYSNLQIS